MHSLNLRDDIDALDWEELYPGVIVYRNMLSNPDKAYEIMMRSEESSAGKYFFKTWDPWAHFGTYTQAKFGTELAQAELGPIFEEEKSLYEEIAISYDKAISHYFKHTGIEIPEGARYSGQSWCKYFNKIDNLKNNMTMQYHTDYIISQRDMPGEKFHTTCTFYINDNYNGGDIEFYINGDIVNHKPKAGDLVVFPSGAPFFHGVKTIPDGNKFFIRNFVMFDYDGSAEWLANQKKHGAYRWAKMEEERIDYEDKRNMVYLKDQKIIPYEQMHAEKMERESNEAK
jgi:hypothetical protein